MTEEKKVESKVEAKVKSKLLAKAPEAGKPGKIKMMVFSKSGIGKTWLSMDFPKPYYIDCEGGARLAHYQEKLAKAGGKYFGVEDGALDFSAVLAQVQALATEQHEFQTLAVGSISKLYQTAIANEAERLGDKDAFGASKKPAIAFMRRFVNWIQKLDMNVLFEAHEVAEWGLVNGQRSEIGQQPDAWDKLLYELDLTLRLEKQGPSRYAVVRKSRLTGFPEGERFPLEYAEFATRYGKDFIECAATPIVLARPEQITEIRRILELVKVEEKEIEKVFSKANAESWEELSEKQADASLAWLKKRMV